MSTTAAIIIGIAAVVVLAALAFVTLARRSDVRGAGALSAETVRRDASARQARDAVEGVATTPRTAADAEAEGVVARTGTALVPARDDTGLTPWTPPDPEAIGVSRRQFFNRATISLMGASLGTFSAAAFVAFLWPTATGGFGGKVSVGKLTDIKAGIAQGSGFFYAPEARSWITAYPPDALSKAEATYQTALLAGMREGIIVSYQKCPHLGCRVPQCVSSQWFECGCHGSQYNRVGEKKGGPAPRGMDHFAAEISGTGDVVIDTGTVWQGRPIGTNTTGQEAEGPNCVGAAEH
jgi:cytochrome b6-f complex iron-sulfur subunit